MKAETLKKSILQYAMQGKLVAQDPNDKEHYFVTSYGMGILEMQGKKVIKHYTPANSGLISAVGNMPDKYTRTDGIMYDDKGNLWILNTGGEKLGCAHVIASNGKWTSLQFLYNNTPIYLHTPGDMFMDRRDPSHKWIALPRSETGMILLQDNGTPHNPNDDKITYRTTWIDQNNNPIAPANIYTAVQDRNNTIWVGTSAGLFIIPPSVDFATSNKCERIIMPRNDGTNFADYFESQGLILDKDVFVRLSFQNRHGNNFILKEEFEKQY